jgi:excisionase family DNA binding protein
MSALSTELDLEADATALRPVLCLDEAADLLGIRRSLMLHEIKRGNIPHKRLGPRLVFSRQRLLEWLANDES